MLPPQMALRVLIICLYTFQIVAGLRNASTANQKILHFIPRLMRYCLIGPGAPLLTLMCLFPFAPDVIFSIGNSGAIVCMCKVLVLRKRCQLRVVNLLVSLFAESGKGIALFELLKKCFVHTAFEMPYMCIVSFCVQYKRLC
jgi:hypothetical protein